MQFIAEAQANALSGCTIGAQVAAGDPDRADSFVECEIEVNGLFDKVSESKIAAALGAVSVDFCNGPDSDSTDLFAEVRIRAPPSPLPLDAGSSAQYIT